ncbi:MAG: galactose-1-phosphate uridylyltransferase [Actinobacteria bacterium]|nr:galactose-1-phosphate uridylyltransferase [Actinomycetota bacterium]
MPEYRKDIILDEWVIISTERAKRPENFREDKIKIPVTDAGVCPFDKGNESMTPPEILRINKEGIITDKNDANWQMRVVPNKFPALTPAAEPMSKNYGIYTSMDGFGLHEVVIHSPEHITNISRLDIRQIKMLLDVYARRIRDIKTSTKIESVTLMLNQGKDAGASIEHSHSQIFGLPLIPPVLEKEIYGTARYFKRTKKCAMCAIIEFELAEDKRVVYKNDDFIIIQPYASRNPFETWIVPKAHEANFENIEDGRILNFADCLKKVVDFFYFELGGASFNYYIHTGPLHLEEFNLHYHWNFELIPKLSIKAGFEVATGIDICITTPEYTAEFMKSGGRFA